MLNALPVPVRNTLCGPRRASAECAKARPRQKPDEAAQQPCPQAATPNAAQHRPQRRLPTRHRQLAPLRTPRPGLREPLAPPLPPAAQRDYRDPPLAPYRLHTRAAVQRQCTHHHEQRRHAETPPEEARRGRRHPTPAAATAQAVPPGIRSELRRQAVGLARVARAVQVCTAMRAPRRAPPRRLGLVNLLEKGPDAGVGKNGVEEESMRH